MVTSWSLEKHPKHSPHLEEKPLSLCNPCCPVEWQLSGPFRSPTHFATAPDVQPGHVSATQVFSVEGSQTSADGGVSRNAFDMTQIPILEKLCLLMTHLPPAALKFLHPPAGNYRWAWNLAWLKMWLQMELAAWEVTLASSVTAGSLKMPLENWWSLLLTTYRAAWDLWCLFGCPGSPDALDVWATAGASPKSLKSEEAVHCSTCGCCTAIQDQCIWVLWKLICHVYCVWLNYLEPGYQIDSTDSQQCWVLFNHQFLGVENGPKPQVFRSTCPRFHRNKLFAHLAAAHGLERQQKAPEDVPEDQLQRALQRESIAGLRYESWTGGLASGIWNIMESPLSPWTASAGGCAQYDAVCQAVFMFCDSLTFWWWLSWFFQSFTCRERFVSWFGFESLTVFDLRLWKPVVKGTLANILESDGCEVHL